MMLKKTQTLFSILCVLFLFFVSNPHYLLLNLAMGGTLGGNIPNSFDQDTLEVDYVRYYR